MTDGPGPVNDPGGRTTGASTAPATIKSPGARGILQLALNPECGALQAYRLTHRDLVRIAEIVDGGAVDDPGSEIALAVGLQFETVLRRDDFAVLRTELAAHGRVAEDGVRILDIDAAAPGADDAALAEKARLTDAALRAHAAGASDAPDIIWHPRLFLAPSHFLNRRNAERDVKCDAPDDACAPTVARIAIEPDFLVTRRPRRAGHPTPPYQPGEIKTLRDRGAATLPEGVRYARLQAAVEVLALRSTYRRLGLADAETRVPSAADLVLRRRLGMRPSLRACRLDAELDALARVLRAALRRLPELLAMIPPGETLDTAATFAALPRHLTEGCHDHCALAAQCTRLAHAAGAPDVLGDRVARAVGTTPLPRVLALLTGRELPNSDAERRLADGLREAVTQLTPVLSTRATGQPLRVFGDLPLSEVRRAG